MMWTGDCFKPETEATSDSAFVSGKHHVMPAGGTVQAAFNCPCRIRGWAASLPRPPYKSRQPPSSVDDQPADY